MKAEETRALYEMEQIAKEIIAETHTLKVEAESLGALISLTFYAGEMSNRRAKSIDRNIKRLQNKAQNIQNNQTRIWEKWQKIRRAEHVDN